MGWCKPSWPRKSGELACFPWKTPPLWCIGHAGLGRARACRLPSRHLAEDPPLSARAKIPGRPRLEPSKVSARPRGLLRGLRSLAKETRARVLETRWEFEGGLGARSTERVGAKYPSGGHTRCLQARQAVTASERPVCPSAIDPGRPHAGTPCDSLSTGRRVRSAIHSPDVVSPPRPSAPAPSVPRTGLVPQPT